MILLVRFTPALLRISKVMQSDMESLQRLQSSIADLASRLNCDCIGNKPITKAKASEEAWRIAELLKGINTRLHAWWN